MSRRRLKHFGSRLPGELRATLTSYGPDLESVEYVEVVIHTGDGQIVAARVWTSDQDVDVATTEMIEFIKAHGVQELREVSEVMPPQRFVPVAANG